MHHTSGFFSLIKALAAILKVLGEGFEEKLLSRRFSPILLFLLRIRMKGPARRLISRPFYPNVISHACRVPGEWLPCMNNRLEVTLPEASKGTIWKISRGK